MGSGSFIYNGYTQKAVIIDVTQKGAPIIAHLQSIREGISELSASSGLYLLTREKNYQDVYQKALSALKTHITSLDEHKASYPEMVQSLVKITEKLNVLDKSFVNVMRIGADDNLNKPALLIAGQKVGPIINQMLQITVNVN
ncbi:CHASE3 domain-containing protein [sulfur-oxidizing endosymbiont of Gigantopelta aegis]|uniref:CHASE3 domain-containing protein n=1 Tax=sulfur-oxidizing endosymbiont of Gigantopelta aegis TaxID=2794934 RepID=UPI001BE3F348|nr:hypothetical protein [sulfur-oxidizing endosymbiont of Gigantopelta aegis]